MWLGGGGRAAGEPWSRRHPTTEQPHARFGRVPTSLEHRSRARACERRKMARSVRAEVKPKVAPSCKLSWRIRTYSSTMSGCHGSRRDSNARHEMCNTTAWRANCTRTRTRARALARGVTTATTTCAATPGGMRASRASGAHIRRRRAGLVARTGVRARSSRA